MSNPLLLLIGVVYLVLTVLMCVQESKKRKLNLFFAFILCVLITPLFAYFVFLLLPERNPRGCKWCGNNENEAVYCGLCGKNEKGDYHPDVTRK